MRKRDQALKDKNRHLGASKVVQKWVPKEVEEPMVTVNMVSKGKSKKGVQVTELLQEAQDFLGAPSTEFHKTRSSTVARWHSKRMSQSPAPPTNYT